ncbi:MAG: plasmid recombination protein [Lachnospiraceae bacterium]|nr:plasmid recombination protein [Ruminococcus sp.]MCM1275798.1 plasmid recombination protein [Lachnospiraceae bacterium]
MNYEKYGKHEKRSKGKSGKTTVKPPAGRIIEHDARTSSPDAPDRPRGNENIDPTRTHLNYDLAADLRGGISAKALYTSRLAEYESEYQKREGKAMRKDAVTYCSWCITMPKDLDPKYEAEFFRGAFDFICERVGTDNIINGNVHKDEVTPHIQIGYMPFVDDEKNGGKKLCAKGMETPQTLRQAHIDLQNRLTEKLGVPVNLLNGSTVGGNKTIAELKLKTAMQNLSDAQNQIATLNAELTAKNSEVAELNKRAEKAESELAKTIAKNEAAERELAQTLKHKANASAIKKPLFDKSDVRQYHDNMLESIRAIGDSAAADRAKARNDKQEAEALKREIDIKANSVNALYQQAANDREQARKLKAQQEYYIDQRAREIAEKAVNSAFESGTPTTREKRLEEYCGGLTFGDGTTVLEGFERSEQTLKMAAQSRADNAIKKHNNEIER